MAREDSLLASPNEMASLGRDQRSLLVSKLIKPEALSTMPIATGRVAGAGHVDRANRVCLACNSGAIGD